MKSIKIIISILFLTINGVYAQSPKTPIYFEENFNEKTGIWPNDSNTEIIEGKYIINNTSSSFYYLEPNHCIDAYQNYTIETDFKVIRYSESLSYGIHWGNKSANGTYFIVGKSQNFKIGKWYNSKETKYKDWTFNEEINTGENAKNVLKISRKDNITYFYINNKLVHQENIVHNYYRNGFEIGGDGKIEIDKFTIFQKREPINIAPEIPLDVKKEKMNENINSNTSDLQPVISADGKLLFIDRQNHPDNTGSNKSLDDIWFSEKQTDNTWSKAKNIGIPLNNDDNNSVMSITADNNTLLVQNIYLPDGKSAGKVGFSLSHRTVDGWSVPEELKVTNYYNNDPYGDASLASNGKSFILSVGRNDTYGGRDMYISFLQSDNTWSEPLNLGPNVNSFSDESGVFLAPDGVTLYFASSSWPGYGNRDIFVSKRLDNSWTKWSKPLNLGPNINTKNFEGSYITSASGDYAYMVSRTDETAEDIYIINLKKEKIIKNTLTKTISDTVKTVVKIDQHKPDPVIIIYGKVLDSKTNQPIGAKVSYENLATAKEEGIANSNPANGDYKIVLPFGYNYGFHAKAPGYISVNENMELIQIHDYKEIEHNLYLTPIEIGQTIKLNNVFFVRSKPELLPLSYPELDRLIAIMKENPTMEIELAGHTDNQGDAKLNLALSEDRVETVKKYMVSKGIKEKRIIGKGYGGSKPIADNKKEETRKLNRRVEFTILKI